MAIEFVIVVSMLLVSFLVMLQYAVKAHASHVAQAAAEQGAEAAAAYHGTAAAGETTARAYVAKLGGGLTHVSVTAIRTGATSRVTITGDAQQVFPFVPVHVHVSVTLPAERFVAGGR
jgi:Flp pilus assembly protein TadG